jgi:flagellar biosynthesis protein FlhG
MSAAPARSGPPFVLVTGGKGGVGKTTLVANAGIDLARRGLRPLLLDLDLSLANLHVLFGVSPRYTLEDFFAGERSLEGCVHSIESAGVRLDVLPAASGLAELCRPDEARFASLFRELDSLSSRYDLVLGDSAAGIGADVLFFSRLADRVLVVTTPEPAALTDAFGLVKALDGAGRELGAEVPTPELFLNLVHGSDQATRLASRLRGVCERFLARSPRLAGWMPRSNTVLASSLGQRPFGFARRDSLERRCLGALSLRLESGLTRIPG